MGSIGIDEGFISQLVNFILLFIVLYFALYKRILAMLDQRKQKIEQGLADAQRASAQAAHAQEDYEERLKQAKNDAQAIIAKAKEDAERIKTDAKAEARREAKDTIERERKAFENEREKALAGMQDQVVGLVLAVSRKLLQETLDEKAQRKLIDRYLEEMGTSETLQ